MTFRSSTEVLLGLIDTHVPPVQFTIYWLIDGLVDGIHEIEKFPLRELVHTVPGVIRSEIGFMLPMN